MLTGEHRPRPEERPNKCAGSRRSGGIRPIFESSVAHSPPAASSVLMVVSGFSSVGRRRRCSSVVGRPVPRRRVSASCRKFGGAHRPCDARDHHLQRAQSTPTSSHLCRFTWRAEDHRTDRRRQRSVVQQSAGSSVSPSSSVRTSARVPACLRPGVATARRAVSSSQRASKQTTGCAHGPATPGCGADRPGLSNVQPQEDLESAQNSPVATPTAAAYQTLQF